MTRLLQKKEKSRFNINNYINTLSVLKSKNLGNRSRPEDPSTNFHLTRFSKKPGSAYQIQLRKVSQSLKSNPLKFKSKAEGNSRDSTTRQKMNRSDNNLGLTRVEGQRGAIQNRVLASLDQTRVRLSASQKNQSMVLNREIDEWSRKLRSSIPNKQKNNTGYPRIKLNVFLDQINK